MINFEDKSRSKPYLHSNPLLGRSKGTGGFTFLEIIIVVAIVAFAYSIAIPNFNLQSGNEVASRIGKLSEDLRSAFDYSILSKKPLRMVFRLHTGEYWLEETESPNVRMGNDKVELDPLPEQEKEDRQFFDEEFQRYIDLAGESITDPENEDESIFVETPVTKAKNKLRKPFWSKLDSLEWETRNLGDYLIIRDLQAEHHVRPISLEDGSDAVAMIYFLPHGYVEKSVIHIYFKDGEGLPDENQEPFTVITYPYEGYADVISGLDNIDFDRDD